MEELITRWKELNKQAIKLLRLGKSFRQYNAVRLQMDKIEDRLSKDFDIDIWKL